MCALVGIANGADVAKKILTLETEIATHHWDQVKDRDATLTYNKYSRAELESLAPHFLFDTWATNAKVPAKAFESLGVCEPSFFESLSGMFARFDSNRDSWVAWLKLNLVSASAAFLTDEIVQQNFEFYAKTLSGTPQIRDRWKRGVSVTQGALGEAIGKVYVEKHFPARAKQEMKVLVDYLLEAYRLSILELPWMSDATKQKALEKLKKFTPKIGYPDKWRDYSTLEISADDLIGNLWRIAEFDHAYAIAKIGAPVDRDEWHMTPQTVNAYYNPQMNDINFPAGVLQPPLYDPKLDDAPNYGNTGGTIGHELTHAFDDEGRQFDAAGNLKDWWAPEDAAKFEERAQCIVDQYAQYVVVDDVRINSKLTLGEDVADLGGLLLAHMAWRAATANQQLASQDGLTPEQRFFVGYAQWACENNRPENQRLTAKTDPHSPGRYRVNGLVVNMPQFEEAFVCKVGQPMVRKDRCRIW